MFCILFPYSGKNGAIYMCSGLHVLIKTTILIENEFWKVLAASV